MCPPAPPARQPAEDWRVGTLLLGAFPRPFQDKPAILGAEGISGEVEKSPKESGSNMQHLNPIILNFSTSGRLTA